MIDRALFLSSDGMTYDGTHPVPSEEVTALMLALLDLKPGEKLLEIGTGSGYQTRCFADAGADVYTLEHPPCSFCTAGGAGGQLHLLRGNAAVYHAHGDGRKGWPYPGEFDADAIVVTCGMESVPIALQFQLKEGGRLVAPIGNVAGQELRKYSKQDGQLKLDRIGAFVRFVMCEG